MTNPFHLDLILDLLNGCQWRCPGCGVEKTAQDGWARSEDASRTLELMCEFATRGYNLDHLELGPTDFMTARNAPTVLEDERLRNLQKLFRSTLLTTTFLSDHAPEWAERLNRMMKDLRINFFHVIDIDRAHDRSHLLELRDRRDAFLAKCDFPHDPLPHPLLNVEFRDERFDLGEVSAGIHEILGRGPYHVFSVARGEKASRKRLLASIETLNRKFDSSITGQKMGALNFYYGSERDGLSRHYIYRNGSWYWPPILYSPLVSFSDDFRIPVTQWRVEEFERWESQLMLEAYAGLDAKEECLQCSFLGSCAKNGLMKLQDHLETVACLAPRGALETWNTMG